MTRSTVDSPASEAGKPRRPKLGKLGKALDPEFRRLQREYLSESSAARADLARLRRGLGKPAGSVPDIWGLTVGKVPAELAWTGEDPSRAEQAAHAAMTLYALHQQSLTVPIHKPGERFGAAVRRLSKGDKTSEEAVTRRFMAVATAQSIEEVLFHVRGLITQLRREKHALDYAMFADDILNLLTPGRADQVRLAWGREFYRTAFGDGAAATDNDTPDATSTPDRENDDNE
jgi:CRISPR system Cascade subunit CasB